MANSLSPPISSVFSLRQSETQPMSAAMIPITADFDLNCARMPDNGERVHIKGDTAVAEKRGSLA